jgi:thiol-disulfide isomerase/thioredoxin
MYIYFHRYWKHDTGPEVHKEMKRLFQLSSVLVFTVGLVLLAQRGNAGGSGSSTDAVAFPAPSWELPLVGGEGNLSSADLAGKILVIDFWATWCPPCRAEIPGYIELQDAYGEDGVVFVGISLDQGASAETKVSKFMETQGINYLVVMGTAEVAEAFGGVPAIPTTFVVDREGQVVDRKVGYKSKDYFEAILDDLL